ncbi:MAG: hypothetical protein MJE77_18870 [Proteobacteria bacterium]|nr:hypothetical protein [Pseudomonadota bacterium]
MSGDRAACYHRARLMGFRRIVPGLFLLVFPVLELSLLAGAAQAERASRVKRVRERPVIWLPGPETARTGAADVSRIIYVNGCWGAEGCTIRHSTANDALQNLSSIPNVAQGQDVKVSEFAHSQEVWNETIRCLREVYWPYDVEIWDSFPGRDADPADTATSHHEAILAGSAGELGLSDNIGGIALASCDPVDNVISFSFANTTGPDWIELCWTVAQESAHSFGLDHAFQCLDPMTYLPGCGQKFFRNELADCGEFSTRPCNCGGMKQNSHNRLLAALGPGQSPAPPDLDIVAPRPDNVIGNDTQIEAVASDPRLVDRLELYINGWLYKTQQGHAFENRSDPYQFELPALPDSVLDIEVRAYNDLDSMSSQTLRVTKGAPCSSSATCLDGQECDGQGRCIYPAPTGKLGDVCERPMDCISHLCPQLGNEQRCSEICIPGLEGQCPADFECLEAGSAGTCWPIETAGCCSAGAGQGPTPGQILLFLLCAGMLLRPWRRRRSPGRPGKECEGKRR